MEEHIAIASAAKEGRKLVVGGFAIDSSGRVLLLQRSSHEFMANSWELPSGGVERGESFVDALEREFLEETGLKVRKVGPFVNHFDYGSNRQFNYLVEVDPEEPITLSDEHQDAAWLDPSQAELDGPMRALVDDYVRRFPRAR